MDNVWLEIGKVLAVIAAGAGVWGLERLRQWFKDRKQKRRAEYFQTAAQADTQIYNLLIELRTKLDAGRVHIMLFHNGQSFTNNNPLWRMSCTHETCSAGISHEMANQQNILYSNISRELIEVWKLEGMEPPEEGESFLETDYGMNIFIDLDKVQDEIEHRHRAIRYVLVETLKEGFWKSSLLSRGIWALALTTILKEGIPAGLLVADWISDDYRDLDNAPEADTLQEIAYYATRIE